MYVEAILATKGVIVQTLPASATLADAVTLLNRHNIGAVIISDEGGTVTGILSERDIVRQLGANPTRAMSMPIEEAMTRGVITCTRATTIEELMEQMTTRRIRHMPVVEDGVLIGIVSIGDVVKYKIEAAEQDAAALRDYIAS